MTTAIDLHGVLDAEPKLFLEIITSLTEEEANDIYIVSGPPKEQIIEELKAIGFIKGKHYGKVFSVVDFLRDSGETMWTDEKGTWWASDESWWNSKGRICKENGIGLLIDDHIEYQKGCQKSGVAFILFKKNQGFKMIFTEDGKNLELEANLGSY